MKVRIFDVLSVLLAAAAVVGVSLYAYADTSEPTQVSIQSDKGEFLYPLSAARELEVEGPLGHTHIEIDGERVRVLSSPCRDQICVAAGWLEKTGDWSACLPNRVFVRVEGGKRDDEVDAQAF